MAAQNPTGPRRGEIAVPWPALLDLITSTLMVFLLVTFLQLALGGGDLKAILVRNQQEEFTQALQREFPREVAEGTITVQRRFNVLRITFSDRLLFTSGDYRLQPAGRDMLARCAELFAHASDTGYDRIQVEGHTDDRPLHGSGFPADNWELSAARAISVVRFLSASGRLSARVFSANGYSSYRPAASNATESGRARNRRIEIRLFFSGTGPAAPSGGEEP